MTTHRPSTPRWLATAGAVVLAAVIGTALFLQNGGSACAAPPTTATRSGKATFYLLNGTGHCSYPGPPADDLFVALGDTEYADAAACGSYLDVTGPKGTVRVKVLDSCPECPPGHLDLSRTAFRKIADEVTGVVPITYRAVTGAPTPGGLSARIKEGASRYWFAVLIDNHAGPLRSVKVADGGGFRSAVRADYNYWIIDGGAGQGPFTIEVTDVRGRSATMTGIELDPGRTQRTSVRLSGGGSTGGAAPRPKKVAKSSAPPKRKASPSASAAPSASASASVSASASASATPVVPSTQVTRVPGASAVALAAVDTATSCG